MSEKQVAAVILAAGQGTRMKSVLPKVLHPVAGEPMVCAPVRLCRELHCQHTVLVVGHGADQVREALDGQPVRFAAQTEQLGTGHALLCAAGELQNFSGTLLLLCGDVPLLRRQTLERLLAYHAEQRAAVTVLTAEMATPHGYGRIVRDGEAVLRIVESSDAGHRSPLALLIATGVGVGVVGGLLLGILAGISGGAAGPGRLAEVGPDALLVAVFAALEFGVAAILGLLVGRPARSA